MSRYDFDADGVTWSVGYDAALASYFAQRASSDADLDVVEVAGEHVGDTPTLRDLEAALARESVTLPSSIRDDLASQQPAALGAALDAAKQRESDLRFALSLVAADGPRAKEYIDSALGDHGIDVPNATGALARSNDELVEAVAARLPFAAGTYADMGAQEEAEVGQYVDLGEREGAGEDRAGINPDTQRWWFEVNAPLGEFREDGPAADDVDGAAAWVASLAREVGSPAAVAGAAALAQNDRARAVDGSDRRVDAAATPSTSTAGAARSSAYDVGR